MLNGKGIFEIASNLYISQSTVKDADKGTSETETAPVELKSKEFYLRVKVSKGATCEFSYSTDNRNFQKIGEQFKVI